MISNNKDKDSNITKKSIIENFLKNKSNMQEKEFNKHKFESIKISIIIGLFSWLISSVILKNILLGMGICILLTLLIFILILQIPYSKRKHHSKIIENQLPLFLAKLALEIRLKKSFNQAIVSASKDKTLIAEEFNLIIKDINKGASFQEALFEMNKRVDSKSLKRALSNLSNLHITGKKDAEGLTKLSSELLLKQRIESKEFSGKMTVYSLLFIAVSAIVPAMFLSFILIGSYFMKLSFTPIQITLISIVLFPLIDGGVLFLINSKTPLFLKE